MCDLHQASILCIWSNDGIVLKKNSQPTFSFFDYLCPTRRQPRPTGTGIVPESSSSLLLEKCWNYWDSEDNKNTLRHFAIRIVMCVLHHQVSKIRYPEQKWHCSNKELTNNTFFFWSFLSYRWPRAGRESENFSTLLLEKYRDYGDSKDHKNAFRYFATRIPPAVNASQTRYDKDN